VEKRSLTRGVAEYGPMAMPMAGIGPSGHKAREEKGLCQLKSPSHKEDSIKDNSRRPTREGKFMG